MGLSDSAYWYGRQAVHDAGYHKAAPNTLLDESGLSTAKFFSKFAFSFGKLLMRAFEENAKGRRKGFMEKKNWKLGWICSCEVLGKWLLNTVKHDGSLWRPSAVDRLEAFTYMNMDCSCRQFKLIVHSHKDPWHTNFVSIEAVTRKNCT